MKASEYLKNNPVSENLSQKRQECQAHIDRQEKVKAFEACAICDSTLEFRVRTDWIQKKVHEIGHCEQCQKSTPARVYPLQ